MHFTYERFFPIEYIRAVLSLNIRYPGGVDELTKIEDVIAFYNVLIGFYILNTYSFNLLSSLKESTMIKFGKIVMLVMQILINYFQIGLLKVTIICVLFIYLTSRFPRFVDWWCFIYSQRYFSRSCRRTYWHQDHSKQWQNGIPLIERRISPLYLHIYLFSDSYLHRSFKTTVVLIMKQANQRVGIILSRVILLWKRPLLIMFN